jgi:hypothetical protein
MHGPVPFLHRYGFEALAPAHIRAIADGFRARPERYVVSGAMHPTVFGTPGRRDIIHDRGREYVLATYAQDTSGSTDEKIPGILLALAASHIRSWIVVLTGSYWTADERGRAIVTWLRNAAVPEGRQLHVCLGEEFPTLAERLFGEPG